MECFDVAIVGGGVAGCATALALASKGIRNVLLIDSCHVSTVRVGETIPPDTRVLLDTLGVWDAFRQQGHEVCLGSCSIWGTQDVGYNDFLLVLCRNL